MKTRHGLYTTLAAAIALACSVTYAQDNERTHDPIVEGQVGVDSDIDVNEPSVNAPTVREDARIGDATEDADELADDIEDQQEVVEKRHMLEQQADSAIEELRAESTEAAQMLDGAYGYAVFDTTEGGLIVTGSGGSGVAEVKDSGEQTFMNVAGAGVGLGAGGEKYKLVLVFPDQTSFTDFVDGQWEGGASAQAAAGNEGAGADAITDQDIHVYHLTEKGLIAQADVTGMRFWPDDELNGRS